jgi:hypothetical protein
MWSCEKKQKEYLSDLSSLIDKTMPVALTTLSRIWELATIQAKEVHQSSRVEAR